MIKIADFIIARYEAIARYTGGQAPFAIASYLAITGFVSAYIPKTCFSLT